MIKKLLTISLLILSVHLLNAQSQTDTAHFKSLQERLDEHPWKDTATVVLPDLGRIRCGNFSVTNKKRLWLVSGASALLYTGSFIGLNQAWYAGYDRTGFHFFNDNKEWMQVDKVGHVWTSYQISRASAEAWRWTGLSDKRSAIFGSISGIVYQSIIEIQDGYSREWGFSAGDMGANVLGSAVYMLQELNWKEQRVNIKFSYWPYAYDTELIERRNQLFGSSFMERILKDYNSQNYWLSANIRSFFTYSRWPAWLNIAVGYQADGMLGGRENVWKDKDGNRMERRDVLRTRHYILSPDIDFTKIHTNKKLLRTLFFLMNAVKMPAPALEVNSKGKLSVHALYF